MRSTADFKQEGSLVRFGEAAWPRCGCVGCAVALCSERTLSYLGTMMRQRVEGGAPYRYELRQGLPCYEPDRYDSEETYPGWTRATADESLNLI